MDLYVCARVWLYSQAGNELSTTQAGSGIAVGDRVVVPSRFGEDTLFTVASVSGAALYLLACAVCGTRVQILVRCRTPWHTHTHTHTHTHSISARNAICPHMSSSWTCFVAHGRACVQAVLLPWPLRALWEWRYNYCRWAPLETDRGGAAKRRHRRYECLCLSAE